MADKQDNSDAFLVDFVVEWECCDMVELELVPQDLALVSEGSG